MFSNEKLSKLANSIVGALVATAPPVKVASRSGISARKVSRSVEKAIDIAIAEQSNKSFGYLSRVLLGFKLRVRLREAGYDDEFSSVVVEGLLVELSKAKASGAGKNV